MEPGRKLAIATLQALIALLRIEEKKLQTIITYSEFPERRTQAQSSLEKVLEKIDATERELTKLQSED